MTNSISMLRQLLDAAEDPCISPYEPANGDDVNRLRKAAGLSPTAFAAVLGVSERTVYGLERGEHPYLLRLDTRQRLGRVLAYLQAGDPLARSWASDHYVDVL